VYLIVVGFFTLAFSELNMVTLDLVDKPLPFRAVMFLSYQIVTKMTCVSSGTLKPCYTMP